MHDLVDYLSDIDHKAGVEKSLEFFAVDAVNSTSLGEILGSVSNLVELKLFNCSLDDFNPSALSANRNTLTSLIISDCDLKELNVEILENLQYLNVARNGLVRFPTFAREKPMQRVLRELVMDGNKVSDLIIPSTIDRLSMKNNGISGRVVLRGGRDLESLDISENFISDFLVEKRNYALSELNLSRNSMVNTSTAFIRGHLAGLEVFRIAWNGLTEFQVPESCDLKVSSF